MTNVVLDTNVLVSGLLKPHGSPGTIVRLVASGELAISFDARILSEYRQVLLRPAFAFRTVDVQALLEQIQAAGTPATTHPLPRPLPDPADEMFLEVAIATGAEYLITGNARHFPESLASGVRVVSPSEFLRIYREEAR